MTARTKTEPKTFNNLKYIYSVCASQKAQTICAIKTYHLMILKGNNCYYCENYVKHASILCELKKKFLNFKYGGTHRNN